jgi:hypothetical protein
MSCEGNRHKYLKKISKPGSGLETTFGSVSDARDALEQIFQLGRSRANVGNTALMRHAEAHTRALFARMEVMGIDPPTHSASGLPRKDAQFGYAAVVQTLDAIKKGRSLPAAARDVLKQRQQIRRMSAVDHDAGGYLRCSNCGRFASADKAHLCPMTTNAQKLNRSLMRRLGVSENAYGQTELDNLLETARQGDSTPRSKASPASMGIGGVSMIHNLTGEQISVTLDGLSLAMATGFSPDLWSNQLQQIELPDGRIVSVQNAEDFPVVTPSGNAVVDAAAAYGTAITPGTPFGSATILPVIASHTTQENAQTTVTGGQAYDKGHFMGSEYRKRSAQGEDVEACGLTYQVGTRSQDNADWSIARINGDEPPPRGGVVVGRNLVAAVDLLTAGRVVETADQQIQLYGTQSELLAVYDPKTHITGDTAGNANASAAQVAAILAHRAIHPQDRFDVALATDLVRAQSGAGTPLAAADSGYIVMKNSVFEDGNTVMLGGQVGTHRCPDCGQFAGDGHACPSKRSAVVSDFETYTPPPEVHLDFDMAALGDHLAAGLADALRGKNSSVTPIEVTLDTDTFVEAFREGLSHQTSTTQASNVTALPKAFTDALTQMAQAVEQVANKPATPISDGNVTIAGVDIFAAAVDRLSGAIQGIPVGAAIDGYASLPVAGGRCPRCGQFAGEDHTCPERQLRQVRRRPEDLPTTGQEHIFSTVTLAAPDPYLTEIPVEVGGDLYQAVEENIPDLDPNYEINAETERILRSVSAMLQAGSGKEGNGWSRAFGLYGPPGTGKNTLARQLAASIQTEGQEGNVTQGMNYVEANITAESSMQELIGTTVLEADPTTGATVSRAKLGKIGMAAAMGSVICINEIVRSPKMSTALQSMIEDGEIQIDSPETGTIRIPVHPSTVFFSTWNPGNEGDPDRPAAAPLSRMITFRMSRPSVDEQAQRARSFIANLQGNSSTSGGESRRKDILNQSYGVPKNWAPTDDEIMTATRFMNEVALLADGGIGERQIGLNSDTSTSPGPRQLTRFLMLGKTVGWIPALDTLRICCDQDSMFDDQWRLIQERFEAHFGSDGEAVNRRAEGKAPKAN